MIQRLKAAAHILPWWLHLVTLTRERLILRAKALLHWWCAVETLKSLSLYSKLTFQSSISKPAVLNRVTELFADHPDLIEGFNVFFFASSEPSRGYFSRALPSLPLYRPQNAEEGDDDDCSSKTTAILSDSVRPKSPDEIGGRRLWKRRSRSAEEGKESGAGSSAGEVEEYGLGRPLWRNPDGSPKKQDSPVHEERVWFWWR